LEVVKHILSSEWMTSHQAQGLADKLAAIEKICQSQAQLNELTEIIQQQLNNAEYTKVASQFNFLLNQQTYRKDNDPQLFVQPRCLSSRIIRFNHLGTSSRVYYSQFSCEHRINYSIHLS
jgi:hypothetical protein